MGGPAPDLRRGEERPEGTRLEPRKFPIGLTLAALVVFAACCGLGVWQLQRADWKAVTLKRIAALELAPPQPIGPVLGRAAHGADVTFTRVSADCLPGPPAAAFRLTTDNGEWIARAVGACRLAGGPFDGVVVDRGFLAASRGSTSPPRVSLPAPTRVVGTLFPRGETPSAGLDKPAPVVLVAERETPAPSGVIPAPYAAGAADNLQYVGAYAPTWFGLAGVVAVIYAAMLWRRSHPKPPSRR
ncbi:MAG TPA: SURF1 family cytochrome oxidase biogenesis protein [Caulobacteraceae bacterium]|nr:SURF1 family cytochrome oxidase biogenesis protein [Caulobacteraceae bacterium]